MNETARNVAAIAAAVGVAGLLLPLAGLRAEYQRAASAALLIGAWGWLLAGLVPGDDAKDAARAASTRPSGSCALVGGRRRRRPRGRLAGARDHPEPDGLVRAAGARAADPHAGHDREPGGEPPGAPLRGDRPRPDRVGVGPRARRRRRARARRARGRSPCRSPPSPPTSWSRRCGAPTPPRRRSRRRASSSRSSCSTPWWWRGGAGRARWRALAVVTVAGGVIAALVALYQYATQRHLVERDAPAGERLQPLLPGQRDLLRPQHPGPLPGGGDHGVPGPRVGAAVARSS